MTHNETHSSDDVEPAPDLKPRSHGIETPDAIPNRYSIEHYPAEGLLYVYVGYVAVTMPPETAVSWATAFESAVENHHDYQRPCPDLERLENAVIVHLAGTPGEQLAADSMTYSASFTLDVLLRFAGDLVAAAVALDAHPEATDVNLDPGVKASIVWCPDCAQIHRTTDTPAEPTSDENPHHHVVGIDEKPEDCPDALRPIENADGAIEDVEIDAAALADELDQADVEDDDDDKEPIADGGQHHPDPTRKDVREYATGEYDVLKVYSGPVELRQLDAHAGDRVDVAERDGALALALDLEDATWTYKVGQGNITLGSPPLRAIGASAGDQVEIAHADDQPELHVTPIQESADGSACDCPYKGETSARISRCGAESPQGAVCSKPQGHGGPHAACSVTEHPVETWTDDAPMAVADGGDGA